MLLMVFEARFLSLMLRSLTSGAGQLNGPELSSCSSATYDPTLLSTVMTIHTSKRNGMHAET